MEDGDAVAAGFPESVGQQSMKKTAKAG